MAMFKTTLTAIAFAAAVTTVAQAQTPAWTLGYQDRQKWESDFSWLTGPAMEGATAWLRGNVVSSCTAPNAAPYSPGTPGWSQWTESCTKASVSFPYNKLHNDPDYKAGWYRTPAATTPATRSADSPLYTIIIILFGVGAITLWAIHQPRLVTPVNRSGPEKPAAATASNPIYEDLKTKLRELRAKGKRVVADRDRCEARVRELQAEVIKLQTEARNHICPTTPPSKHDDGQYRQLKNALARMFHPDAHASVSAFERTAREEIYKEITAAIYRIEKGA